MRAVILRLRNPDDHTSMSGVITYQGTVRQAVVVLWM